MSTARSRTTATSMFAAGAVTALVLGGGTAVAATGGTFILGRSNAATTTTVLTNSAGPALTLNSKAGTAPLTVGSTTVVPRFNADLVDGRSASAFALRGGRSGIVFGTPTDADRDPSTARCPAGSIATGGGGAADRGSLIYSGPDFDQAGALLPDSWHAEAATDGVGATAWVVCYNPAGAVPGAATRLPG